MTFDWWNLQNLVGILAATVSIVLFCVRSNARFILLYFLLLSLIRGFPQYFETEMTVPELLLSWLSMKAFATIVVVWLLVNYLKPLGELYFFRLLFLILTADAIWQLFGGFGIFVGTTHDPTILAALLPLLIADKMLWGLSIVWWFNIFHQYSTTSFLILGFHAVFIFAIYWRKMRAAIRIGLGIGFGWAVAAVAMNPRFGGERWENVWKEHLEYWWENSDLIFGFGPNSFQWLSILVPKHKEGFNLFWLHSDWLQILVEYGFTGLVLSLGLYFYILAKFFHHKDQTLFPTWVGLGVAMVFYSPAQFFLVQVIIGILIKRGLQK